MENIESNEFTILDLKDTPERVEELRALLLQQWASLDPFEGIHANLSVPAPLAVYQMSAEQLLVGGLAFSTYAKPRTTEIAVWVNALFIHPEWRGRGLAKRLIQRAELAAKKLNIVEIFVQSEFPQLYESLGWTPVEQGTTESTLRKMVSA